MRASTQPSVSYCARLRIGLLLTLSLFASSAVADYTQHNLVTDDQQNLISSGYAAAANVDINLVNPWGISQSPTSPFWVSNNGTGVSSLYNGSGTPSSLVVSIPGLGVNLGNPTGQVFNADTASFIVSDGNSGSARFLFATEEGIISGWNPAVPPPPTSTVAIAAVDNSASGAVYKGLAIDNSTPGSSLLYVANFATGVIDVFDHNFAPTLAGSFTDPNLPSGYVPFNIQNLDGEIYVTYAFKTNSGDTDETAGAGLGIVDLYDTQGTLIRRLINDGGVLDAPWGLALAPSGFGEFSGDLLVGNFGDGKINAFDPLNGNFLGTLSDINGSPIVIDGLWGLAFGNGGINGSKKDTLYFAAGINDEEHGLFGSLSAVPEPATLPMIILGLALARSYTRRSTESGSFTAPS